MASTLTGAFAAQKKRDREALIRQGAEAKFNEKKNNKSGGGIGGLIGGGVGLAAAVGTGNIAAAPALMSAGSSAGTVIGKAVDPDEEVGPGDVLSVAKAGAGLVDDKAALSALSQLLGNDKEAVKNPLRKRLG